MFECISDFGSVASSAALHSYPLATRRHKALSSTDQTLLSTSPNLSETTHFRGQSLDLGRKNADTSSSKNSDIDHALSQASSGGSISDTESSIYGQNYAKYVPQGTKLPTPNRQVIEFSFLLT
jgi:hypothetical protein